MSDPFIETLKKHRDLWERTYWRQTRKLMKHVINIAEKFCHKKKSDIKIAALGAGTPFWLPEELRRNTTAVDVNKNLEPLWKKEGGEFVHADIRDIDPEKIVNEHDIIVFPSSLSQMDEPAQKRAKEIAKLAFAQKKPVVSFDTSHVFRGYQKPDGKHVGEFREILPPDWGVKILEIRGIRLPLGIWVVRPVPMLIGHHLPPPGEMYFVESYVHHSNEDFIKAFEKQAREWIKDNVKSALSNGLVKTLILRRHRRWL